ncbi:hypothetical protein [Bacillus sp. SM2101]|uniref:hypothetical protein n=1 Tax=Bacillus sp. SM2101 TaxID=2805366 RepID=UPI001BDF4C62|nr:hypothetical protein [Bacillus sp. SM2101]
MKVAVCGGSCIQLFGWLFQDKQTSNNKEMMMIARGEYERSVGFYANTSFIFLFD